jgi:hypothetical protein
VEKKEDMAPSKEDLLKTPYQNALKSIAAKEKIVSELNSRLTELQDRQNERESLDVLRKNVIAELYAQHPEFEEVVFAKGLKASFGDTTNSKEVQIVKIGLRKSISKPEQDRILSWLQIRCKDPNIQIVYEQIQTSKAKLDRKKAN